MQSRTQDAAYHKNQRRVEIEHSEQQMDLFLTTIKKRGFMAKASKEQLLSRATVLEYDAIANKLERFMDSFEANDAKQTFATFIINHLLQTQHELHTVE